MYILSKSVQSFRDVTRLDDARGKKQVWRPMFEPELFRKQMYYTEESTCGWDFSSPPQSFVAPIVIRRPGNCQWHSQPKILGGAKKFWGGQNVWFYTNNTILFGKTHLKTQNDYFLKIWGSHGPFAPLAAPMVIVPPCPPSLCPAYPPLLLSDGVKADEMQFQR